MATKYRNALIAAVLLPMAAFLSGCSIARGLMKDGTQGPTFRAYRKVTVDTVFRGTTAFVFPMAAKERRLNVNARIQYHNYYDKHQQDSMMTVGEFLAKHWGDEAQLLILRNDSIVYDRTFAPYRKGENSTVFSVTKSLTSLLCGIAVDEGYIRSVEDPVTAYLPELKRADPNFQKLKIVHLLNMQAGLDFGEHYSLTLKNFSKIWQIARLYYGKDLTKVVRRARFKHTPGEKYEYNSLTSAMLSLVIERATGTTYARYMSEKVWQPLGMEADAWISIDSRRHHNSHGFGGMATNVYDLAKIGRLYRDGGRWNGRQIVSRAWVDSSWVRTSGNDGYHYNWYHQYYEHKPGTSFYALGMGHQFLYVNTARNVIITWVGKDHYPPFWQMIFFDAFCEKFL